MKTLHHQASDAYLLALGRFVNEFSVCENMLYRSLVVEAELSPIVAESLISKFGTNQAIEGLRKMYRLRKVEIPAEIDRMLRQFKLIAEARNAILHNGSLFDRFESDVGISSSFWKQPSMPRTLDVSIPMLASLYEDCCAIRQWLLWHQMQHSEELSLLSHLVVQNVGTDWQYIPQT